MKVFIVPQLCCIQQKSFNDLKNVIESSCTTLTVFQSQSATTLETLRSYRTSGPKNCIDFVQSATFLVWVLCEKNVSSSMQLG